MNRLAEFRARARMSQEDLAELSGVAVSSIRGYETEKTSPSINTAKKLVKGFALAGVYVSLDRIFPMEK